MNARIEIVGGKGNRRTLLVCELWASWFLSSLRRWMLYGGNRFRGVAVALEQYLPLRGLCLLLRCGRLRLLCCVRRCWSAGLAGSRADSHSQHEYGC